MVSPKSLVREALTSIQDGVAGAHRENEDFEEDGCKVMEAWAYKGGASAL